MQTYENGIAVAEILWPSANVAVVLAKNRAVAGCVVVAYSFEKDSLVDVRPYMDNLRSAISKKYLEAITGLDHNPDQWRFSGEASALYVRTRKAR
jgi:hypothetical protein